MIMIKIDKIIRSRRRSIALVVAEDATLVVRAPFRTPLNYIEKIILAKKDWIERAKNRIIKNGVARKKEFVDGELFLFLGQEYKLKIEKRKNIFLADCLYFPEKYLKNPRKKMIDWYKKEAREKINERADYYSKITGWKYKKISITSAKRRWGSCASNSNMNFTWRLILAPMEIVDYVVVHELAHIVEKNHSAKFWGKVALILPDYKKRNKWLKENRNFSVL